MNPNPMREHASIEDMLGAYVLDAVDDHEAEEIRAHLTTCPRCRSEVDALREVASALGTMPAHTPAPAHLWDRIAARLHAPGSAPAARGAPPPDDQVLRQLRQRLQTGGARGPRARRGLAAVAAAAVLVLLGFLAAMGVELAHVENQVNQTRSALATRGMEGAVVAALANPRHTSTTLRAPDGRVLAQVVTLDGRGYFLGSDLTPLAAGRTYQLWGLMGGRPISLGLLGSHPTTVAFTYGSATPSEVMVTVEPAHGVVSPDQTPIARGRPT